MRILIINGPNLNMLGIREPQVYGTQSFEPYFEELKKKFDNVEFRNVQSNHEGTIIDTLQSALIGSEAERADGVILNAGALTHYSYALTDAISAIRPVPVVEVHLSNPQSREEFRRKSVIAPVCRGSICGFGLMVYELATRVLIGDKETV